MISFLLWYLTITMLGWLAFPVAHRFFPGLPDRGYNLARALGLLLWAYLFWLLATFGFLQNDAGGLLFALALVVGITFWSAWRDRFKPVWAWIREHWRLVLTSELVFLGAFILWAVVRAMSPEIFGTEKPMEMAFINAIIHSSAFPPHDPWLSGYAISYYYFGYVMAAMLIEITGISSGVGFNLAIALWFALTTSGCFCIIFNLLESHRLKMQAEQATRPKPYPLRNLAAALFGPVFVLLVSNLDGILEVLHARGLLWQKDAAGHWVSQFWTWLDIQELTQPPAVPLSWIPIRPGGILWWRASRVLQDYTLDHQPREIIDEFPFFSYLLSDLHPHVLAMPFVLLAIGLALNLYLHGTHGSIQVRDWFKIPLSPPNFLFSSLILGSLGFLNTWDFPVYVALFCGAYALLRYQQEGWSWWRLGEFIGLGVALGLAGAVLYLPFYLGFSSQAGGIIPSLIFTTRGVHFWVMFATLLIPILIYLIYTWRKNGNPKDFKFGLVLTVALIIILWVFSYGLGILASLLPTLGAIFMSVQGAGKQGLGDLIGASLLRRVTSPGTWLTLGVMLVFIVALIKGEFVSKTESDADGSQPVRLIGPGGFILLLILFGAFLTLIPEFVYLRDQFGYRINTIFKFYFETWMVWGLAAAFSAAFLLGQLKGWWSRLFQVGLVLLLLVALIYPAFGLWDRTNHFHPANGLTLDGTATLSADELAAVHWLQNAPEGVLAEAINEASSYSLYSRISEYSGDPAVIGWTGHESQWRGNSLSPAELGLRVGNMETLYRSADWQQADKIIKQYQIRYIIVGDQERTSYRVNETKFQRNLKAVFSQGPVVIYEVTDFGSSTAQTPKIGQP